LSKVAGKLPELLKPDAFVTWVIMPKVCLYELAQLFKGNLSHAFRRFKSDGISSHVEGYFVNTYYHSLSDIRSAFPKSFKFVASESLSLLIPQPHQAWLPGKSPRLFSALVTGDRWLRNKFPFNRWGDHIIVTFQYKP
jgi:hypothetical protein